MFSKSTVSTKSLTPPPTECRSVTVCHKKGGQVGGGGGVGNLQTDAAKLFLSVPIPAKAKKLGLLSIYKFSLSITDRDKDRRRTDKHRQELTRRGQDVREGQS